MPARLYFLIVYVVFVEGEGVGFRVFFVVERICGSDLLSGFVNGYFDLKSNIESRSG